MICDLNNHKSHALIQDALRILVNLTHRGACGCDETTGDGAGISIQKPHVFLQKAARAAHIALPEATEYAAGLVFLPADPDRRRAAREVLVQAAAKQGLSFLGWRKVPINPDAAGDLARLVMPVIRMAFVGSGRAVGDPTEFERRLYCARKTAENTVRSLPDPDDHLFHIVSLSSRTLVYKGMLLADQMTGFYPDLTDPDLTSAGHRPSALQYQHLSILGPGPAHTLPLPQR